MKPWSHEPSKAFCWRVCDHADRRTLKHAVHVARARTGLQYSGTLRLGALNDATGAQHQPRHRHHPDEERHAEHPPRQYPVPGQEATVHKNDETARRNAQRGPNIEISTPAWQQRLGTMDAKTE